MLVHDLRHSDRNGIVLYADMEIPVYVGVIVEIMIHARFFSILRIEQLVEENAHFFLVLRQSGESQRYAKRPKRSRTCRRTTERAVAVFLWAKPDQ